MTDSITAILKGFASWNLAYATGCGKDEAMGAVDRAWDKRSTQIPTESDAYDLMNDAKDELMERLRR